MYPMAFLRIKQKQYCNLFASNYAVAITLMERKAK